MRHRSSPRHGLRWLFLAVAPVASGASHASFFAGEALDQAADVLAWVIIVLVPLLGITLFWLIHILPEKIAHKRHHPQLDGIKTLCLLSLVFGGLLWPIAWLWAYTRPAGYKLAYGTDKHEDYFTELGARARAGSLDEHEMLALRADLAAMAAKGSLSPGLIVLREDLDRLGAPATGAPPAPAAAAVPAAVPTSPAGTQS
jgi:hypothetical protein